MKGRLLLSVESGKKEIYLSGNMHYMLQSCCIGLTSSFCGFFCALNVRVIIHMGISAQQQ